MLDENILLFDELRVFLVNFWRLVQSKNFKKKLPKFNWSYWGPTINSKTYKKISRFFLSLSLSLSLDFSLILCLFNYEKTHTIYQQNMFKFVVLLNNFCSSSFIAATWISVCVSRKLSSGFVRVVYSWTVRNFIFQA